MIIFILILVIDFDYECESKDEQTIRAQLLFHQQTKNNKHNLSVKGKTEKTKWSENYKGSENENYSSDGEISFDWVNEIGHNSMARYFYDPSLMKNHKKYLGGGSNKNPHPAINKNSPTKMNADLGKIQNEWRQRKQE
jgi:hypothetical protein